ncbi:hypothetical protein M5K25_004390 [Dendrobium thyrsiflorum]|uniref:Uncharacterized protein n=1 Tax=Dendrobium thyrsiflorum TaxID=117978 RepID=A0ABD0VM61_DENTH
MDSSLFSTSSLFFAWILQSCIDPSWQAHRVWPIIYFIKDCGAQSQLRVDKQKDPELDHEFVYNDQGQVNILNSSFFDVNLEIDHTIEDCIDRIVFSLAATIDEQLSTVQWRIVKYLLDLASIKLVSSAEVDEGSVAEISQLDSEQRTETKREQMRRNGPKLGNRALFVKFTDAKYDGKVTSGNYVGNESCLNTPADNSPIPKKEAIGHRVTQKLPPLHDERFVVPVILLTEHVDIGVDTGFGHCVRPVDLSDQSKWIAIDTVASIKMQL